MLRLFAVLLIMLTTLLAGPALTAQETASGKYRAQLEIKALKNDKTGRVPQLPFSGSFAHHDGKFRMEVISDLTTESQVFIFDTAAKKAWVLFPDTLNGISADLAQFDKKGFASSAQSLMGGDLKQVPKDWGEAKTSSTKLNGETVTQLSYKLPTVTGKDGKKSPGGTFDLYHRADKTPGKIVLDSSSIKLTVDFMDVQRGGKVDASQFAPGTNYKIRPLGKDEMPPLPGGLSPSALGA